MDPRIHGGSFHLLGIPSLSLDLVFQTYDQTNLCEHLFDVSPPRLFVILAHSVLYSVGRGCWVSCLFSRHATHIAV